MELGNTSPLLPPANPSLSTLAWDLGQWLPPQSLCVPICPVGTGTDLLPEVASRRKCKFSGTLGLVLAHTLQIPRSHHCYYLSPMAMVAT